jgi:hypothetical protein
MMSSIENHVCESCCNNLDINVLKIFREMDSREFVNFLTNKNNNGNHESEIQYYLSRVVDQNYINEVLDGVKERYRHDLYINGPLRIFRSF